MLAAAQERVAFSESSFRAFSAVDYQNEARSRQEAEELIRSVGGVAIGDIDPNQTAIESPDATLTQSIHHAKEKRPGSRQQVEANVRKDVFERGYKIHITEYEVELDSDGRSYQHNQYLDDTGKNALEYASEHPIMRTRAKAEIRNNKRRENAASDSTLDGAFMIEISRCPEAPDKVLKELKFFVPTKSCSIRVSTVKDGKLVTCAAFVAGVRRPGAERHDRGAVVKLGAKFNIDYEGLTEDEVIDKPIFVAKDDLPTDVLEATLEIVKMYDESAGGTFFGEAKPNKGYRQFAAECKEREDNLEPIVQQITNQLIYEAPLLKTAVDGIERLDELSEEALLNRATVDKSIDPIVFGEVSAPHIYEARSHIEAGRYEQAMYSRDIAYRYADSSSCPSATKSMTSSVPGSFEEVSAIPGQEGDARSKKELGWHGGEEHIHRGKCVNCDEVTMVGKDNWCEDCIKGHCGTK